MNIVIITGNRPHCTDLCKKLSKDFNVVAVFHYDSDHVDFEMKEKLRLERLARQTSYEYAEVHRNAIADINDAESIISHGYTYADEYFATTNEYGSIDKDAIHTVKDINSSDTIMRIRDYQPDVVVCHGGPKYSELFVTSFPLVINYHSGISPIYNGSDSHLFAMSNGHPHLCGGTLMVLNSVIDGGDILGHFTASIDTDDTPKSMFIKCVQGCYLLTKEFLSFYENNRRYTTVAQPKNPIFYFRRADWNLTHVAKLTRFINDKGCQDYVRSENHFPYWNKASNEEATASMKAVIFDLIYSG